MIYVTGDTHANIDIEKLNTTKFPQQKNLTKDDYLIICGDFGLCWDGSRREMWWQDWLTAKNFTTLWIDGNHENFDMLYEFPLEDKFGGKVRQIAPDIYHLDRGQVLTIDGKKIFCMAAPARWTKRIARSIFHGGSRRCRQMRRWSVQFVLWSRTTGQLIML